MDLEDSHFSSNSSHSSPPQISVASAANDPSTINSPTHKKRAAARRKELKGTRYPLYGGKRVCGVHDPNKKSIICRPEMANVTALAQREDNSAPPKFPDSPHGPAGAASSSNVGFDSFEKGTNGKVEFVDEEAIFNLPLLLDSMAEGMLLTPPAMMKGLNWSHDMEQDHTDLTLWGD